MRSLKDEIKVKVKANLSLKTYWRRAVTDPAFLTSEIVGSKWSASRPGSCTPGERVLVTYWTGWVGLRAGLAAVE